jgi:deazaflavin-dependent oxidoreductase (nitroreductase family)
LDRPVLRWSSGRWSAAGLLTGLPTLMITTTGARTGRQRTTPLVGLIDRERVVLVASYFGSHHHPAWYHNLRRHPGAQVSFNGRSGSYVAREADGAEYESYWRQAVELYAGYGAYKQRTGARHIPILVLTPRAD